MNICFLGLGKLGLPVSLAVENKGIGFLVMIFPNKHLMILETEKSDIGKNG